jgi:hypothetical protein
MKRESLLLRRRKKISQKLPSEFETELVEIQRFVIGLRRRNKYSISQIDSADETAVFSTCLAIIPYISKGKPSGNETTGYKELRATVILCITANSNTLPPYVTLHRNIVPKENFYKRCNSSGPPQNAWMTSELMEDWLQCVRERRSGALPETRGLLVTDISVAISPLGSERD